MFTSDVISKRCFTSAVTSKHCFTSGAPTGHDGSSKVMFVVLPVQAVFRQSLFQLLFQVCWDVPTGHDASSKVIPVQK